MASSSLNLEDAPSESLMSELLRRMKCAPKPEKRLILIGTVFFFNLFVFFRLFFTFCFELALFWIVFFYIKKKINSAKFWNFILLRSNMELSDPRVCWSWFVSAFFFSDSFRQNRENVLWIFKVPNSTENSELFYFLV